MIGYGLRGDPRGVARDLIRLANSSTAPMLSLDAPSGAGHGRGQALRPLHPRRSHHDAGAAQARSPGRAGTCAACGDLYLADISVPPELYAHLGLEVEPLFASGTVLPLHVEDGQATIARYTGDAT